MEKGRIIQKGTHEQLIEQDGMYRQIYDLQTRIDEELEVELSKSMVNE
jgi:ATP-binding cassette subfamily B protein